MTYADDMIEIERLDLIEKLEGEHIDMLHQMLAAGRIICVYPQYWRAEA